VLVKPRSKGKRIVNEDEVTAQVRCSLLYEGPSFMSLDTKVVNPVPLKGKSSAKKQAEVDILEESDDESTPAPAPKPVARRGRKATTESDASTAIQEAPNAPVKPTRKPRAAKLQEMPPAEVEPEATGTTRTVRMRSKAKPLDVEIPSAGSGGSRRRAKVEKLPEVDGDEDPLDTIGEGDAEPREEVPAVKPKRAARGKTQTPDIVKLEETAIEAESDVLVETPVEKKRAPAKASTKASGGTGTRSSARSKKVAAAAVTPVSDVTDKENVPGVIEDGEPVDEKPVKVRVSRTKKIPTSKEKAGDVDVAPEVVTRATRARTRK